MKTRYQGLEISEGHWRLVEADEAGTLTSSGEGAIPGMQPLQVVLIWSDAECATLQLNGQSAWEGRLRATSGAFGLLLERESHARVAIFRIDGELHASSRSYLSTEGLLSATQQAKDWESRTNDPRFTFGVGALSNSDGAEAKWNIEGSQLVLHGLKGPEFGRALLVLDGKPVGEINYQAPFAEEVGPVLQLRDLAEGRHTVRLKALEGRIPVDVLEVTGE
jgi:hypothetical protein